MNFDFADEHRMLGEQLRRLLAAVAPLAAARATIDSREANNAAWRTLIEIGVTGATIGESDGGLGLGAFPLCIAAEEIGWSVAAVPTDSLYLGATLIALGGSPVQRARWLPLLASGAAIACAVTQRDQPLTAQGETLTGTAGPVPEGMTAQVAVIAAASRLWLVDLAQQGIVRSPLETLDPGRPVARLELTRALAEPLGAGIVQTASRHAAAYTAFEQVGGAARALDEAIAYARGRRTFGRAIAGYQAIKHKLADMWASVEIARAHAMYAAWALEVNSADLPLAVASARAAATEAYLFVAREALQVHGGFGFTFEADCHLFYRRARALAGRYGSAPTWRAEVADLLVSGATPVH